MIWLRALLAQTAPPQAVEDWMTGRWAQGGALTLTAVVIGWLFRRFIRREDSVEAGWKALVEAAQKDADEARKDAVAARVDAREAQDIAHRAEARAIAAEQKAAIAQGQVASARMAAAQAKAEADECHVERLALAAQVAELTRRMDAVDTPWDGTERRRRQLPPPPAPEGEPHP